ncbi:MAG: hypothetical protein ABEJ97_06135, partial [Halobellus sp.]
MSHDADPGRTVSVADEEVRVEKSFAGDEFPVPAIKFQLASESDDPVHVRIVDQIPEDFPMEGVGFHPDYESEGWTAYKDHRVEFERTLEPGESVTTVYGVRLDDAAEIEDFLGEPILERPPRPGEVGGGEDAGSNVEDILGADRSQLVRDALQGRGRLADEAREGEEPAAEPGSEPEADEAEPEPAAAADDVDAEPAVTEGEAGGDGDAGSPPAEESPTPRTVAPGLTPALQRTEEAAVSPVETGAEADETEESAAADAAEGVEAEESEAADQETESEGESEAEPEIESEPESEPESEYVDIEEEVDAEVAEAGEVTEGESEADAETAEARAAAATGGGAAPTSPEGGLAATLAAEIRAGDVDDEDLETLREELDAGLPRSADVRIRRLQAQMEDLNAYADAIAEFIDEEGTGAELVERVDTELTEVEAELDELRSAVDDAADDRESIREDVSGLRGDVDATESALESTDARVDDVAETAEAAATGMDDLQEQVDAVEDRLDEAVERLDGVAADVGDVTESVDDLADDLSDTDERIAQLDDEMGDVREDIAALDGDVVDVRETLEAEIDDLRRDLSELSAELDRVESIEEDIRTLKEFRDRLNSAFGPGGAGGE